MRTVTLVKVLDTADADGIATSQDVAAAGDLTLDGTLVVDGVGVLDTARRVIITSAGDDSKVGFTVRGGSESGTLVTEIVQGASKAAASSSLDFLTVTQVTADGKSADKVTVGTNDVGSSPWVMSNPYLDPFNLNLISTITGTVTYNVEGTLDDFAIPATPTTIPAVISIVNAGTKDIATAVTSPYTGWRVTVSSGAGAVTVRGLQAGITNS